MSCLPPPLPSKPCRGLVWSLPEVRGEGVPFLCSIRHHLHLVAGCWLRWTQPCCWVHTLHGATTANTARCLLQLCLPLSVCHTSPAAFSCPDEWGDIWSSEISSLSASCRHQCEFVAVTSPVGCKVRQEDITAANLQKIIRSSAQLTAACFLAPIWDDFIIFLTCSGFTGLIIRVLPSSFFPACTFQLSSPTQPLCPPHTVCTADFLQHFYRLPEGKWPSSVSSSMSCLSSAFPLCIRSQRAELQPSQACGSSSMEPAVTDLQQEWQNKIIPVLLLLLF